MKKRYICFILAALIIFMFCPTNAIAADNADTLSAATTERVFEEVLSGNITSDEDVLAVALAQYEAKPQQSTYSLRSASSNDEPLKVEQIISTTELEDGTTEKLVASTALLVLDSEGNSVNASEIQQWHMSGSGSLSAYNVSATHTMYVYVRVTGSGLSSRYEVKVAYMKTTLQFGSAYKPSALLHRYAAQMDPVGLETAYEEDGVTNLVNGNSYTFTPSSAVYILDGTNYGPYIQTSATIYVDSTSFSIVNTQPLDPASFLYLEYGW